MREDGANLHRNHRERLRGRFLSAGLEDFAAHNVLELLLFYPIPRRDTNPTAHALLAGLGSVEAVLSAGREALCGIPGIGEGVSRFFLALRAVTRLALGSRIPSERYGDADTLGRRFCCLLDGADGDRAAILFLDNDFHAIGQRILEGVSVHSPRFSLAAVAEEALLRHAPSCAVAHLHADGLALPAAEDLELTRELRSTLDAAGIRLVEHFLVGGGRYSTLLYRYSGTVGKGETKAASVTYTAEEVEALGALLAAAHIKADAAALLSSYGGLYPLLAASPARHRYEGVDDRLAALLALCLASHAYAVSGRRVPPLGDPAFTAYLSDLFRAIPEERVLLFLFDREGRHLATHVVGRGSVGEATVSSRRVAEGALFSGAKQAVLAHNHPSGAASPSREDRAATDTICRALGGLGITLLGHYIVAGDEICDAL